MSTEKNIKIRQRVDEETNWVTKNPILLKNETAYLMSSSVTSMEGHANGYTARGIKIGRYSSDKQNWSDAPWLYHSGDEYITWGGRDTYANYHGPLDATMIKEMGNSNNLLAFVKPSAISIEYSIDGGETWLDKNISDIVKQQMVTCAPGNTTQAVYVGDLTSESYSDTNRYAQKTDQLRVTIDARLASLYCSIDKIALEVTGIWLEDKYYATLYTSFDGETWTQRGDKALMCGWPGWNVLNRTYQNIYINGWGTTYPRYFRITFIREGEPHTNNYAGGLGLRTMAVYGKSVWNCSFPQYNKFGHLYTYDVDKNVNFPAELHATSMLGVNSYNTATGITITPNKITNNYATNGKYTNVTGNWDFNDNLKVSDTLNANDIFTKRLELIDNQAQYMTMTPTTVELPSYLDEGYTETTVHGQLIFDSHDLTSEFKGKLLYNDNEIATIDDVSAAAESLEMGISTIEENMAQYFTITSDTLANIPSTTQAEARIIGKVPSNINITEDMFFIFDRINRYNSTINNPIISCRVGEWVNIYYSTGTENVNSCYLKIDLLGNIYGYGENIPEITVKIACIKNMSVAETTNIADYTPNFNIITAKENPTTCIFKNLNISNVMFNSTYQYGLRIGSKLSSQPCTIKIYLQNNYSGSNYPYANYLHIMNGYGSSYTYATNTTKIPDYGEIQCYIFENVILDDAYVANQILSFEFHRDTAGIQNMSSTWYGGVYLIGIEIYQDLKLNGSYPPNTEELLYVNNYASSPRNLFNQLYYSCNSTAAPYPDQTIKNEI